MYVVWWRITMSTLRKKFTTVHLYKIETLKLSRSAACSNELKNGILPYFINVPENSPHSSHERRSWIYSGKYFQISAIYVWKHTNRKFHTKPLNTWSVQFLVFRLVCYLIDCSLCNWSKNKYFWKMNSSSSTMNNGV